MYKELKNVRIILRDMEIRFDKIDMQDIEDLRKALDGIELSLKG